MGKKLNSLILATALTCLSTNFVSAEALDTNTQDQIDPITLKESVTEDGFRYVTNNDDTITIRAYEGKKTKILIPNEIDGKSVTKIDGIAFGKCKNLTEINIDDDNPQYSSEDGMLYNKDKTQLIRCPIAKKNVTIPDSVTEISGSAFSSCCNLTEIKIPDGVQVIKSLTFRDCSLTKLYISKGVTEIKECAFFYCPNLTSITVDENNQKYSSEDDVLYNKEKTELLQCPIAKKEITLHEGVKILKNCCFVNCKNLTKISIPTSVTEIESAAFKNCSSLTEIEIPEGVTAVRQEAFGDCSKLRKIKIAESVKDIGIAVFLNCNLTIYGEENSSAQTYANENKIAFKLSSEYDKDILPDDPISPETTTYTVKFLNDDGSQIGETQEVEEGKSAIAPENPEKEGYTFTGWNKDFSKVTSNMEVTAIFKKNDNGKKTNTADAVSMTEIFTMFAGLIGTIGFKIRKRK